MFEKKRSQLLQNKKRTGVREDGLVVKCGYRKTSIHV